jgi:hypothetical protein
MAKYVADAITIASIWPGQLESKTLYHGLDSDPHSSRATRYWIPPVKKNSMCMCGHISYWHDATAQKRKADDHSCQNAACTCKRFVKSDKVAYDLIEVSDSFENVPDYRSADDGKPEWSSKPVPCEDIVQDLLRFWAGNMVGIPAGASPGIIAIAEELPSEEELTRMLIMQTAFAEFQFQTGERLAIERDWKGITQTMRDMADWLERPRPWANPELASKKVECPACRQPIPGDAYVCHHCRYQVHPFDGELAKLNAPGKPVPATA